MTFLRSLLSWVALAILAMAVSGCGRKVELMSAMPESEANEVMAALQNAGIPAEKVPGKEGMVGVSIASDQMGRAVDLLRDKGLPRERFAGMGQVFKKEGLISSPLEERARYLYALSQELGATLSQIDGVVVARVHVVLPERSPTGEAGVPSSAAVFIKHQEGYNLDTVQPLVRRLVTNSIPGLTADKVSIILVNAQPGKPASPGEARQASDALLPVVVVLAMLLFLCVGGTGFLAWKYWWPNRATPKPEA
ncbi:type III secretion system inner membrane ring lipoprotein SctJ [Ramlibacter sp. MAHUQ-53]|uniref:type III secretion system inner membrane ring lipoprotein SctJ n=1 Tax=unclassified Ramlibacter TaxID=2617605 RepID=UPI00363CFF48